MNEFIVTHTEKKIRVDILDNQGVIINKKNYKVSLNKVTEKSFALMLDNTTYEITYNRLSSEKFGLLIGGNYYEFIVRTKLEEEANEILKKRGLTQHHDQLKAPMPGLIIKINKKIGDAIRIGDSLFLLEAMKMENEIKSPVTGLIKEIFIKEGDSVEKDKIILTFE